MVDVGTVLINKYRIDRVLGQGGMGVVALAYHLQLHQQVAIKFLLPEVLDKPQVVQRFVREAQASVRLKGEHVCRVIDVGTLETGAPYMVMEYLEGMDLDAMLANGRIHPAVAVDFMLQACEAMAEAHALGIVHRDLKPSNFFLTHRPDGSPLIKVLDFGISKTTAQVEENLTSTQSILGTPAYMSPEQLKASKYVDARADIWSLGVVLYELLVGRRPFTASAFSELVLKVAMEPVPLPDVALPGALADIVMRCLQKEPEGRFQSVAELALALAPYAQTPSIAASAVERTARILHGGALATPPPGGVRAGTYPQPASHDPRFHTAPTAPQHPRAIGNTPSTLGGSSGEIVRPPGVYGQSGAVSGTTNGAAGAGGGGKRRGWLIPSVVASAVIGTAVVVALMSTRGKSGAEDAQGGAAGGVVAPPQESTTPPATAATPPATATSPEPSKAAASDAQPAAAAPGAEDVAGKGEGSAVAEQGDATPDDEAGDKLDAKPGDKIDAQPGDQAAGKSERDDKKRRKRGDKKTTAPSQGDDDILGSRQ